MGFLRDAFSPKSIKYNLPPGIGTLYGGTQGSKPAAASSPPNPYGYDSRDPNNPYPPGTDPNRNKESGLAYGVPFQLRSQWGQYPGVPTLMDILNNPGQTDSTLFNNSLSANSRNTQQTQDSARAGVARSGYGGSGLAMALQAAIGQAGSNQAGTLYANEARRREDLKRSDLDLLNDFFVNPKLSMYGANKGVAIENQRNKTQKRGAEIGGAASLIGMIAGLAACHTADELYGEGSDEAWSARHFMAFEADPETIRLYDKEGGSKRLAEKIRHDPALREKVRGIFDTFVERGAAIRAAVA